MKEYGSAIITSETVDTLIQIANFTLATIARITLHPTTQELTVLVETAVHTIVGVVELNEQLVPHHQS